MIDPLGQAGRGLARRVPLGKHLLRTLTAAGELEGQQAGAGLVHYIAQHHQSNEQPSPEGA